MSALTVVDQSGGSELDRLWSLLSELSAQLTQNRQQTEELHKRADQLKAQAIHAQTGFTLRRFNTDVSQEEFESELERLNVSLVLENQSLQAENRQLSSLLKDYEGTLEAVMGKFRAHAHATQTHHLDLVRHYEGILLALPADASSPSDGPRGGEGALSSSSGLHALDADHLSLSLAHLASLIRKALRSLQGEDPEDSTSPMLLPSLAASALELDSTQDRSRSVSITSAAASDAGASPDGESSPTSQVEQLALRLDRLSGFGLSGVRGGSATEMPSRPGRDESEGGYIGKSASSNPHYIHTTSTSSLVASPPKPGAKPLPKEDSAASKGLGPVDDALEREIEVEALRKENAELRRLLGIADDSEEGAQGPSGLTL